ncbi:MAG: F0F1 ATP synthase subunit gamma [Gammaproteobacteria bacterium]|nr:F0F1 ATP synthase subunit gamma [Gammaproteobacteria bacterium]
MGVGREIKTKIASIKNTQKITGAMEKVAVSKMRKAQNFMRRSRPYAKKMLQAIGHIAKSRSEYRHRYLIQNDEPKKIGYFVITSDRGLCGGLNINMLKLLLKEMNVWRKKGCEIEICTIGIKGEVFFRRFGGNVIGHVRQLGDAPSITDIIGIVKVMLDRFEAGDLDRVYVASNEFVNTMTQRPYIEQLVPLVMTDDQSKDHVWDYIYEPDAKELLDTLLSRYIETEVHQAVVENVACEQSARMIAMKNATENAGELIGELQQMYNKARQASITQEITEIVSGSEAV